MVFGTSLGRISLRHFSASARAHRQRSHEEHAQTRRLGNGLENAEEAIRLVVGTGREVDVLAASAESVIARRGMKPMQHSSESMRFSAMPK
jgi:hypothetical protein